MNWEEHKSRRELEQHESGKDLLIGTFYLVVIVGLGFVFSKVWIGMLLGTIICVSIHKKLVDFIDNNLR